MSTSSTPTASILHADLDAFYASVEQRDDASLRGRPVIVGGGVVLAASYEAKKYGVKTAMNERQARRLCPNAVVVPPRFEAYTEASRAVFDVFDDTTPLVEPLSIDEAFLDVAGLRRICGSPETIAGELRGAVLSRVGLAITVGVARTKFLAKVASGVGKPDGLLVVPPDGETAFLHPLLVQRLWGVGPTTSRKLNERGIETVGDVAELPEDALVAMLGKGSGHHLHALAHNRDPRRVETGRRRRSVGSQQALGRGTKNQQEVTALVHGIADRVMQRLRTGNRLCRTVVLRVRYDDQSRATRSQTLPWPTSTTEPVLHAVLALLNGHWDVISRRGLTLVGLSVTNLTSADTVQLSLPLEQSGEIVESRRRHESGALRARHDALDDTLDELRQKFGSSALTRASLLGHDQRVEMPKLPD
jgi:DNA polymerase-4